MFHFRSHDLENNGAQVASPYTGDLLEMTKLLAPRTQSLPVTFLTSVSGVGYMSSDSGIWDKY